MPSRLLPYAFLLSIGITSTIANQDLRYYQDLIPHLSPEEIALKQLEKLLKSRNHNAPYHAPYGSPSFQHFNDFGVKEQHRREFDSQGLDPFSEESIIHPLPKRRHISNYPPSQVGDGLEDNPILRGYAERNPRQFYPFFRSYPGNVGPFTEPKPQHHNVEYPTVGYHSSHHQPIRDQGMKEEPLPDFRGKYIPRDHQKSEPSNYQGGRQVESEETEQEFTYRFEEPNTLDEKSLRFAVRPNEPGYYNPVENNPVLQSAQADVDSKEDKIPDQILADDEEDSESNSKEMVTIPEPFQESINDEDADGSPGVERRADIHSPLVTPVDRKISNDIYFVAVVAGCSAAAMFILVLISLTWCRLQRGAKAAADVEYPAYGVTGPNKDTSPSGDRRLAQSAQMYHYQHQKQQIIAMESRTATARDHGSVSEAESDEENEEGDYTVYECPGLAPTGEMEVKNPLFHDDPTPATPAGQSQPNRSSEDHNI